MRRILLVDDRETDLFVLQTALRKPGRELVCARSGEDAIGHVTRGKFGGAVLDVEMPGIDGITCVAELE